MPTIALPDESATRRLAALIARQARPGDVIALEGPLGAGKTAFARGFIQALPGGEGEEVPSPTFTLAQSYDLPGGPVWHFDLYRLARPEDALELGIEDAFAEAVTLIEWPERLGPLLPARRLRVVLAPSGAGRQALLEGWEGRLPACGPEVPADA
ncbi:MAG: tRNA (adenosine(37)-N6)-threonylcarbamoyltransferase complex ATPase subunit type 1 TsaE [Thalassobaculales bacterium]